MEDKKIVDLYFQRDENAIEETSKKYGRYCYQVAMGILRSREDSEECVNDTYAGAWDAMPPHRPDSLKAFLGKLTRRLSLKRVRLMTAQKRGGGEVPLALDELGECIPAKDTVGDRLEEKELAALISRFLRTLPDDSRRMFVQRYFYLKSVKEIAHSFSCTQSRVKSSLYRVRLQLKEKLKEEGGYLDF